MHCLECGKFVGGNATICEDCLVHLTENKPAGFWLRISALLLDYLLITVAVYLATPVLRQAIKKGFPGFYQLSAVPLELIQLIAYGVVYYTIFEGSGLQGSIGKLLMGLKVVNEKGEPLDILEAFFRSLSKAIFSFGFLLCHFPPKYRALHDTASRTEVVRANDVTAQRRVIVGFIGVFLLALWETATKPGPPEPAPTTPRVAVATKPKDPIPVEKVPVEEVNSGDVHFVSMDGTIFPVIDTFATSRIVSDWPEIVFLFFDEPLSNIEKSTLAKQRSLLSRATYRRLEIVPPVFAITVALRKLAQTCNEFTYSGVYFTDMRGERPRTAELVFVSWNGFERITRLTCNTERGSDVTGKLNTEKKLTFPDKSTLKLKLNVSFDTRLR